MILIIDNYDSFVQNLARYAREAGAETMVVRNDAMSIDGLLAQDFKGVILSPGPGGPKESGACMPLLSRLDPAVPVLGVCLGHQCLVEANGGAVTRARIPLHGEASRIRHDGTGVLRGLPNPFPAGRYHSLIGDLSGSTKLQANAWSDEGEVMGVRHVSAPWHGVQFHPESLLTPGGRSIIRNFLDMTGEAS